MFASPCSHKRGPYHSKKNEKPEQALQREIKEELGIDSFPKELLITVQHAYTQFQVKLYAYSCSLNLELRLNEKKHRWVTLKDIRHFPFPSGSAKIIKYLEARERRENKK